MCSSPGGPKWRLSAFSSTRAIERGRDDRPPATGHTTLPLPAIGVVPLPPRASAAHWLVWELGTSWNSTGQRSTYFLVSRSARLATASRRPNTNKAHKLCSAYLAM